MISSILDARSCNKLHIILTSVKANIVLLLQAKITHIRAFIQLKIMHGSNTLIENESYCLGCPGFSAAAPDPYDTPDRPAAN